MKLNNILYVLFIFSLTLACKPESKKKKQPSPHKVNNALKMFDKLDSSSTGISFTNEISPDQELLFYDFQYQFNGGGVGVADFDNDGLQDIFFAGNEVDNKLYKNLGNFSFEDVTTKAGVAQKGFWCNGVTIIDINNDGYKDIYISKGGYKTAQQRANSLLINNGDFTFTEAATTYNIADTGYTTQSAFFDMDLDGDLDLYVLNHNNKWGKTKRITKDKYTKRQVTEDRLYRNDNGKFENITQESGLEKEIAGGYGLGISIGDLNNDNYPDLYISNDYDSPDRLYINQKDGTFKNEIKDRTTHIALYSMGNDIADINNDGFLDVVVLDMSAEDHVRIKTQMGAMAPEKFYELVRFGFPCQYMYNTLQLNNGNGTFSDIAQLAGISSTDWSWAPLAADFDNDGYKDLLITNGYRLDDRDNDFNKSADKLYGERKELTKEERRIVFDGTPSSPLNNYIYKNNGDLTFSKKTFEWNLQDKSFSMGAAFCDLDNDGDLDFITNNLEKTAFVYKNNAREKNGNNYLRVDLKSKGKPLDQTRVVVYQENKKQIQVYNPTRGYLSSVETILHFGLNNTDKVDKIEIFWPNNTYSTLANVEVNQTLSVDYASGKSIETIKNTKKIFTEVKESIGIDFHHVENEHNDFIDEILLPHRNSQHGPEITVADVNGDKLDDFYICGAKGQVGTLYIQTKEGKFQIKKTSAFIADRNKEDVGAHFFDYNNDGFTDLYVASGGNEFPEYSNSYNHRLYKNDGKGNFLRTKGVLPEINLSGKEVSSADFDNDGDLDLFIGGRLTPKKYPFAPRSYLLVNNNGTFTDQTEALAPDLLRPGLVTDAKWVDYDNDSDLDLIVVGEWMPLLILENQKGKLKKIESKTLKDNKGWWYSIESGDFDNDGDQDFIAGNLGLNYKYKASENEPFQVWCHDFDNSGTLDIVLGYYDHGACFPVRGRTCSSQQMPFIKEKFPTFNEFANATIEDIYGEQLAKAYNLKATNFANSYIENLGNGEFKVSNLPNSLQFSCIQDIIVEDFNKDGKLDILGGGNLYTSEVETPRNDASIGFLAYGDGKGAFNPIPFEKSGVFLRGDVKNLAKIVTADEKIVYLVGINDEKILKIKYQD